jgi:uncharacterized membrane protein YdjX (TVP38/TMEM64 family)
MKTIKARAVELGAKIKKVFEDRKQQIKGFASAIGTIFLVSIVTFVILFATGVFVQGPDGFMFNEELFRIYQGTWWGTLGIVAILSVLTILLCFIPGLSMAFILLINHLYPDPVAAFIISFARVMLSSTMLYALGRFGGYKLCKKLLGEADSEKALTLLRDNGTVYFPLMMMFPIFPDDALTMVAGTIRMKLAWFIPSVIIGRGVGVATIIFGMQTMLPDKSSDTYAYDWFVLATVIAFGLVCVFYLASKLNKMMALKRAGKYKPFKLSGVKPAERFGIVCSVIILLVEALLYNSDVFFPGEMSLYNITISKAFELLIVSVFWSVVAFFAGRGMYSAYLHCEKYGKPAFAMKKVTLARIIPVVVTVGIVGIATAIGFLLDFFPEMSYPYDKIIIVTAYIIWSVAIYALAHKVTFKIKHRLEAKAAHKAEENEEKPDSQ